MRGTWGNLNPPTPGFAVANLQQYLAGAQPQPTSPPRILFAFSTVSGTDQGLHAYSQDRMLACCVTSIVRSVFNARPAHALGFFAATTILCLLVLQVAWSIFHPGKWLLRSFPHQPTYSSHDTQWLRLIKLLQPIKMLPCAREHHQHATTIHPIRR